MRLINKDETIDKLQMAANSNIAEPVGNGIYKYTDDFNGLTHAVSIVEDMPEQAERPKGEWIPSFGGKFTGGAYWFECSKCKRIVPEVRNGGWNFCPNCGCDMR